MFEGYVIEIDILGLLLVVDEQEVPPVEQVVMHDKTLLNNDAPDLRDEVNDLSQKEEILVAQHGFEQFQLLDFGVIVYRLRAVEKDFQDVFFVDFVVERTVELD